MALIDIIEKINKQAQLKVEKLQKEYEAMMTDLKKEHEQKKKDLNANFDNEIRSETARIDEKSKLEAEIESKKRLLQAKRKLIDQVLAKATDELATSDKYEELLTEMLKRAELSDSAVVIAAKGKEDATRKAIAAAKKTFLLSEDSADIKGGFIIRDNQIEIDNSFETIIESQLRQSLEIELNKLLFA